MRLRRNTIDGAGIIRRRRGRGFSYATTAGQVVRDEQILDRVRALAIPPARRGVWICPHPNGHFQAMGRDAAGRRQYLYPPSTPIHSKRQPTPARPVRGGPVSE